MDGQNGKKDNYRLYRRIEALIAAIIIAAAAFWTGWAVKSCTQNDYVSSYEWVLRNIRDHYYYEVDEDEVYRVGLSNLRGTVLDQYSRYYTAEEYSAYYASTMGSQSGIGVSFGYIDGSLGKGVFIESVIGNSPAFKSGLRAGTVVTGVSYGGELTEFNSNSDFISFVSARSTGEEFTLVTDRGNFTMAKAEYVSSYCYMATSTTAWDVLYDENNNMHVISNSERAMSFLPEKTAYLSFTEFFGGAAEEMAELISRFNAEGCDTLILDLRNNGGGSVDVLCDVSWLFTGNVTGASDTALTVKYKSGKEEVGTVNKWTSGDYLLPADTDIYVLANCGTASASEALLGVLISNDVISYENVYISDFSEEYLAWSGYGSKNKRTYGKGIMQTTYPNFFTGEAICLTTAVVYWPNGTTIHDRGLSGEDGCKTVEAAWSVTYGDEELQAVVADITSGI